MLGHRTIITKAEQYRRFISNTFATVATKVGSLFLKRKCLFTALPWSKAHDFTGERKSHTAQLT
ncbi:MAG: hypothetical protein NVS9B15_12660 [Acidobacteriaceae bacterium]